MLVVKRIEIQWNIESDRRNLDIAGWSLSLVLIPCWPSIDPGLTLQLTRSSWACCVTTTVLQIAISKKNSCILWEFGEVISGTSRLTLLRLRRHIREISRSRPGSRLRFSITWWKREKQKPWYPTKHTHRVTMRICDHHGVAHGNIQEELLHGFGMIARGSW